LLTVLAGGTERTKPEIQHLEQVRQAYLSGQWRKCFELGKAAPKGAVQAELDTLVKNCQHMCDTPNCPMARCSTYATFYFLNRETGGVDWVEGTVADKRPVKTLIKLRASAKRFKIWDASGCLCGGSKFGSDQDTLFLRGHPIEGINATQVKQIGCSYFRFRDKIYFEDKIIEGAHADTFEAVCADLGRDRERLYDRHHHSFERCK